MNQFLLKTTCSSILCVFSHWGTGKTPSHSLQYVHCALREVRAYSTTIILHLATPLYVDNWLKGNKLSLDVMKTHFMLISTKSLAKP